MKNPMRRNFNNNLPLQLDTQFMFVATVFVCVRARFSHNERIIAGSDLPNILSPKLMHGFRWNFIMAD